MGDEDDGPAAGRRERSRCRSAVAARSDRRGARRGSAAADRADDAARGARSRGSAAASRCRSTSRRRTSRTCGCKESGKPRDVMVGKRGFIDRQTQRADRRLAQRAGVAHLLPLRRRRRLRGGDRRPARRGHGRGASQRLDRASGNLRRIGTPQGTYLKDARGEWVEAVGQIAPVLHGGMGKAARPVVAPGQKGKLGIHHGAARADKALPEIAALIDKEQFELITQPGSGIVVIQGGAGSGKTTVALHRIAYLNFQDGKRFKPQNTLFVVPSQALVRYVAGVLPALGVAGVPVVTYTGWARTHAHALPARRADEVQRRAARSGLARQEAPGDARRCSRCGSLRQAAADRQRARGDLHARRSRSGTGTRPSALVPRLGEARGVDEEGRARAARCASRSRASTKRWKKRADDCVLDWAELLTDPVALSEGFAGTRCHRARHRAARRVGEAPAREAAGRAGRRGRQADPRLRGPGRSVPTRTIRPAGSTTRTIRCCCAWSSSSAAACASPERRRDRSTSTSRSTRRRIARRSR